jgi:hypothetical protein
MVVFFDLDEDREDLQTPGRDGMGSGGDTCYPGTINGELMLKRRELGFRSHPASNCEAEGQERENPNINGFSAALSCYP